MSARSYSVGEVASLAGVSVRTLHHYDETGLLPPASRRRAGYREYTSADLDEPGRDRQAALLRQRELVDERIEEMRGVRALLERTLTSMEGAGGMSEKEMFEGLGTYERNEAEHGAEVRERWGDTTAYAESARRTSKYGEGDWIAIRDEAAAIEAALAELLSAGVPAESEQAMDSAERHRGHISRWFYPCSHEMHANLAEMYVADPRFAEHYETRSTGLAAYVRDAVLANALRAM